MVVPVGRAGLHRVDVTFGEYERERAPSRSMAREPVQ
jgi:hypothetical protein